MINWYQIRTKLSVLTVLFVLICSTLWAQVYQVGTGTLVNTTTSYPAPYGNFYYGAKHQFLVTAAELSAAGATNGDINSIGFDVVTANGAPLTNFEIKIGTTALTDLTAFESGLTSVYLAPTYTEITGVNTHNLLTPFNWDGVSNLIIETCFNNTSWGNNAVVSQSQTTFNSSIYYRADNATVCTSPGTPTAIMQRPNMYFGISGGFPCIDPPTAGVTIANINPICPSQNLVLTLQGQSTGSGQTYQWQTSTDGVAWSPIIGATSSSYVTLQTATTYYRCVVTCGLSSVPSDYVMVVSNPPTQCYCIPTVTYCDEYISDVMFLNTTNPTGCTPGGYNDYTSITYPLSISTPYPITVFNIDGWSSDQCGIWIDWNQDGDFDDADETITIASGSPGVGPYNAIITPPAGAVLGVTRMRIRIVWAAAPLPCGTSSYGEVEDYSINVLPPPSCPFASGITFNNITSNSADIDWADGVTAVGYEVRWKAVADPISVPTWATPTATAVSNFSFTGLLPNTQYEAQVNVDCGGGDLSGFTYSYTFGTSCALTDCPVGAVAESEACGDDLNGGCNMTVPAYEPIACGQTVCGTAWSSASTRDTDWYEFTLTQPSTVTWTVDADFPANIGYVDASAGCGAPQFFNLSSNVGDCSGTTSVQNLPAGTWWLFVSPTNFDDAYGCTSGKNRYVGTLTCVPLTVIANDECTNAISLIQDVACNYTNATVDDATQSLSGCAAGSTANDDVWFSFVAINTTALVKVAGSVGFDAVIQVFDACPGNSLVCANGSGLGAIETALVTGLTVGNTYYVRVYDYGMGMPATTTFDICVTDPGNIIIMNNNNDETTCSAQFYDSGGAGANYGLNDNYTKTIYPDAPNSSVQVVFNSFQTESGYDGLTIYNGPNTTYPMISSGLAAGWIVANCPAGSYYGTTSPGTVTSSDPSGALTFVFRSDASVANPGWDATVGCISSLLAPNCATNIQPVDLSTNVNPNPVLSWSAGAGTPPTGYDVYFGTTPNPPLVSANQPATTYSPGMLSFGTTYYWSVIPVNANGAATGCTEQSFTTGTAVVFCIPSSTFCDEYIMNVTVGTINNASACTAGGYMDYSAISTDVYQGLSYPITIENGNGYLSDQCGIWVDWNQDGDFLDANEVTPVTGTPGVGPYTANIDVPVTANLGQSRIRIRIMYTGVLDPCGNTTYGEAEDYTLNVLPEPYCVYPSALTVTNLTPTDAQLNWGSVVDAVNYLVRYKEVADPGTALTWTTPTVVAAPTTMLAINGLNPNTVYEFQVQTDCGTTPFGFSPSHQFTTPCSNTVCPPGAIQEGELCGDDINGGCNMGVPAYTPISCGDVICGTSWAENGTRDTDWFEFTLTQPSTVTWTVNADFPMVIGFVDASQGCANPQFFNLSTTESLCGDTFSIDNLAPGTWWTFIAPNDFDFYPCGTQNNYVASLNCVPLVVAANDECTNAIPVVWNTTCDPTQGSVADATQSLVGCSGVANDDVWFSFVATNTTGIVEVTGSASFDPVIELFDACFGNSLGCFDAGFGIGTVETGIMTGLTVGNTYYVRVYDAGLGIPATTDFSLCIFDLPPPPVNDNCSGAIAVGCNTPISGSTIWATAESGVATCGTPISAPGVWYTVQGNGGTIIASLCTGTSYDSRINVFSGDCSALVCVGGNDDFCGLQSQTQWTSVAGTTYYILVQGYANAVGNFTLTVTTTTPTAPVITAAGPTTFCTGNTVELTSDVATGIVWSNNETTQTIIVGDSGDYSTTITDGNGCSATSNIITVTTSAPPTPVITSSGSSVCEGDTVTLSVNWNADLSWSPTFESSPTVQVSAVGTYDYAVTITDANGCSSTSAIEQVSINPTPVAQITANGPTTICGTGSSVDLTASGGDSYLWNDTIPTTTATLTASTAGDYFAIVTSAAGCTAVTPIITVGFFPAPTVPTITAGGATTFCDGGSVTLTSSVANAYNWGGGNTSQDFVASVSGTYTVTTTDTNGCEAVSLPVEVIVNPNPIVTITANGNTTFCLGGSVDLTSSAASGNVWSNQLTGQTIAVNTSGSYSTTVTDNNGCVGTSNTIAVTVNSVPVPTITANGPLALCNGATVDLTSSSSSGNTWSTGSNNQTITVATAETITVTVLDTLTGCSATSQPIVTTVGAGATPYIIVGGPTIICEGESVQLLSSELTGNTWSTGETTNSIFATTTGLYTVTYTSPGGCTAISTTVPVVVNPLPTASFTYNAQLGGLTTFTNTSSDFVTSQWNFGDGSPWSNTTNPTHTYLGDGVYTVVLTVGNDCGSITINQQVTIVGTGIETLADGTSLELYPNPATETINIAYNGSKTQKLMVRVVNVSGQIVYTDAVGQYTGQYKNTIDLSYVAKGVYFIQLITDDGLINRKIVLH